MPVYSYQCSSCRKVQDAFRPYEDRERGEPCDCGSTGLATRIFTPPFVVGDITPFQSPGTGHWVTNRRELKEDLARSGCHLNEAGEDRRIARRAVEAKKEFQQENEKIFDMAAKDLGINVG